MYEFLIKIDSKERAHEFWEKSQKIWDEVGVTMKANNEETTKFIEDNTEPYEGDN